MNIILRLNRVRVLFTLLVMSLPFVSHAAQKDTASLPPSNDFTLPVVASPAIAVPIARMFSISAAADSNPVDVLFLSDTTGSMGGAVSNVKTNATSIINAVLAARPNTQFGAAEYKDFDCDINPYLLNSPITSDIPAVQTAINGWYASGGCDAPEAQINAFYTIATDPATGFRENAAKFVVWFGDVYGHDPSGGHAILDAVTALKKANIQVIAVPIGSWLDYNLQATTITEQTGGKLMPEATANAVAAVILDALTTLPPSPETVVQGAVTIAKEVIGATYLWGGKGWDYENKIYAGTQTILNGNYKYYRPEKDAFGDEDPEGGKFVEDGKGVDCSGLVAWAYNRAYDPTNAWTVVKEVNANALYKDYVTEVDGTTDDPLKPGDLLFFEGHVAMYVGPFTYNGEEYDVVHAHDPKDKARVDPDRADDLVVNLKSIFKGYGRLKEAKAYGSPFSAITESPIDLVVTDPEGITVTPMSFMDGDDFGRGVLGEIYYAVYDIDTDGSPKTEVFSPKLKMGKYIIRPIKRTDAEPGAVYGIKVTTDAGSVILAEDVPVDDIPETGYGVLVETSGVTTFVPEEVRDAIPPTTTSTADGTGGPVWFRSDVEVTLIAEDNPNGTGVAKTEYSLDHGPWLTYDGARKIGITTEGTHTLQYYSTDAVGNNEEAQSLTLNIDKTAPEATIGVDLSTKDLKVTGVDNLGGVMIAKDSVGNYVVTDDAGHTTKLLFKKTYAGKLLTYAQLTGIQYDNAATITLPKTSFLYVWNPKTAPPLLLSQTIAVNNTFGIEAVYVPKTNKTTVLVLKKGVPIQKSTYSGLRIVQITTNKGVIGYQL